MGMDASKQDHEPEPLAEHSAESFNAFIDEIMALGYDEETAGNYAAIIGDIPVMDEQGRVVVLDDTGKELARLELKSFREP
jgi:hypothetical protein